MDDSRRVPWSWPEVIAAFGAWLLMPAAAFHALTALGAFAALYGPDHGDDPSRFLLWANAVAFPFQVAAIAGVLLSGGAKVSDFGVTRGVGAQVVRGLITAAWLIPVVYGVNAVTLVAASWLGVPPIDHGFTKLFRAGLTPTELGLMALSATVVAPVVEELCFRGVLQPVTVDEGWVGEVLVLGAAVIVAGLAGRIPAGAALAAAAGIGLVPVAWRGPYAVAVLFAFVHAGAWPSPVPLLPLAQGLGWLGRGGLIGPVVLHAAFNAVAFALLWAVPK